MIQSKILLLLPALSLCVRVLPGQNYFQQTFNRDFRDAGYGLELLPNNDIILAGLSGPTQSEAIWIQLLDAQGTTLWSQLYDGGGSFAATDIQRVQSGGGYWVIYNSGLGAGWIKISDTGDLLYSQINSLDCVFRRILPLSDGGFLISGYEWTNSNRNAFLLKINPGGNVVWKTGFGGAGDDEIDNCWEDTEGFIYCSGYSENFDGNRDGLLARLSPAGALLWTRLYGSSAMDQFAGIAPFSSDNSLLLAGYSSGFGNENQVWLVKVTAAGVLKWSRAYSIPGQDLGAIDLLQLPGNQFVITASDPTYQVGSPAILFKVSEDGDLLWEFEYKNGSERSILREVLPTPDGFAACGSASYNGDENVFLLKIASSGLLPGSDCCPVPAGLTVKDVMPEATVFTADVNNMVTSNGNLILQTPAESERTNLCSFIDLSFTVSDSSICPGECVEITLTGNTPGVDYSLLTPGGVSDPGNPLRVCYPEADNYFIIRKGDNGVCSKELSLRLETDNRADAFPNAFTPNGDGVNDTFKPLFLCPVASTHFRIFNRWGQQVFETRDPNAAWDGKTAGAEAASDVYGWQVEYEVLRDSVPQKRTAKGDVTLLR